MVDYTTPGGLADAVFPCRVYGETVDKKAADSYSTCLDLINKQLAIYGYSPIKPWMSDNLKMIHKRDNSFAPGHSRREIPKKGETRTHMLYCSSCMRSDGSMENENYAEVVATAQFSTEEVDGGIRVSAKVLSLYPHCQQCTEPLEHRRNYLMDRENGGGGYIIVPFPTTELLFQRTQLPPEYSDQDLDPNSLSPNDGKEWSHIKGIVQHLNEVGIDGNHGGTKIDNHTKDFQLEYPFDKRFFIDLDNIDPDDPEVAAMYQIDAAQYADRHAILKARIALWYANTMNLATEIGNFSDIKHNQCPAHTIGYYDSHKHGPKYECHLKFDTPTILFGGKEGDGVPPDDYGYHQPFHKDFCDTDKFSVSYNPSLSGHGKPGSLMIPLSSQGRNILIDGTLRHVQFGQAIFFVGDTPHAGYTSPASLYVNNECHPALHTYVVSHHHDVDVNEFELDVNLIGMMQPHLLFMLTPENAMEQCSKLAKRLVDGCTSAQSNPNYDKMKLKKLLDDLIDKFTRMKQGVEDNIRQDGTEQGNEVEAMEAVQRRTGVGTGVTTRGAKKRQIDNS